MLLVTILAVQALALIVLVIEIRFLREAVATTRIVTLPDSMFSIAPSDPDFRTYADVTDGPERV